MVIVPPTPMGPEINVYNWPHYMCLICYIMGIRAQRSGDTGVWDNQAIIGGIVKRIIVKIDFTKKQIMLEAIQEVLRTVTQYTEPVSTIHRVCNRLAQIITVQV